MPLGSIIGGFMDFMNSAINNMWADSRDAKSRARDWYYYQLQSSLDSKYNKDAMDYASAINKEQYDYEYAKESPAMRSAQLAGAGLNKGLMYSNGTTGMQGSVGSVAPATSRGSMPNKSMQTFGTGMNMAAYANAVANAKLADAQADYYRSEAQENRGETKPSQSRMKLESAEAELKQSLKGHEDVKKAIAELTKKALDDVYTVDVHTENGTAQYQLSGYMLDMFAKVQAISKGSAEADEARLSVQNWYEKFKVGLAEDKANLSIAEAKAYVETLNAGIIKHLEESEGLFTREMRETILANLEKIRRYFAKEFDGSTTELITSWLGAVGSVFSLGANFSAGKHISQRILGSGAK